MGIVSGLARILGRGHPDSEEKSFGTTDPELIQLFGIPPVTSGQTVSAVTAMRVPAVACAVSLIAETVGSLPVKLHDRATREGLKDHPVYRVIHDEANAWTSAEELRVKVTTDALLHGHGFAIVTRNGAGEVLELHHLDPAKVRMDTAPDGEPLYGVQFSDGWRDVHFTDMLHVSAFGGTSPIVLGREAIGLALAYERHVAQLFANGARPSGVLSTEKVLTDDGRANLAASWKAAHGSGRSGGTAVLEEGLKYSSIQMTLTDAQFAENRLEQIREIARVFGVPPTMLFELTRGTWSNTEELNRQFLQTCLKSWLSTWTWAYSRCLLTSEERRDLYLEFVTDDLVTTTTAARAAAFAQYRSAGVLTANEVRGALNHPARPDGDILANPYTTTTTTTTGPTPAPADPEEESE